MNLEKIELIADKVDVGKKRIDGTRVVSCDVGEFQYQELAKILLLPDQTNVKVTLEVKREDGS
jgi:hypothetical protein